jgi:methionine-rich copper-binding protein CopC
MFLLTRVISGFAIAFFAIISSPGAWGHTELKSSSPAKDEVVVLLPRTVSITFSEDLLILGEEQVNTLAVRDSYNEDMSLEEIRVDGNTISALVNLSSPVLAGEYRIIYRVVSDDGHPVEGEIPFIYDPEGEVAVDEDAGLPLDKGSKSSVDTGELTGMNSRFIWVSVAIILVIGALFLIRKRK